MIDVKAFSAGIAALVSVVHLAKQLIEGLPKGAKKDEAEKELERVKHALKMAESQAAHGLEYELCRKHFPPEAMLSADDVNWECPSCGNKKYTGITVMNLDVFRR